MPKIADLPIASAVDALIVVTDSKGNAGNVKSGDFMPFSSALVDIAAISPAVTTFIVGDGAEWVGEDAMTARTSLGLGTIATQDADDVAITGGSITGTAVSVVADTATANRALTARFSDAVNVRDYGAVGDGVTDDTVALAAADGSANTDLQVPQGVYVTTDVATDLEKNYEGQGQLETDGNKRGKFFSAVKSAPSSEGNHDSIDTAFNGDLSHSIFQVEHRITGAATLGQPATGYKYTFEAYPHYTVLFNSSGWNEATDGNDGRTAACAFSVKVSNAGQGDCVAYNANGVVMGTRAGSTSFLANPAASLFNGSLSGGEDGVYLNPREILMRDNGFDVAGIGDVVNMRRDNATGAKDAFWAGYRPQSIGTEPIDVAYSASGEFTRGLDLVPVTFGTDKAAISMKAGDRIYLNATAADSRFANNFGDDYLHFANTGIETVVDGAVRQVVTANGVGIGTTPAAATPISIVRTGSTNSIVRNQGADGTVRYDLWKTSSDKAGPSFYGLKLRGGSTIVQDGDTVCALQGAGWDGTGGPTLAGINLQVDGTPGVGDMPGRITFSTAANGTTTLTEHLRIGNAGVISHRANAQVIVTADSHLQNRVYTVATLPSAAAVGSQIYVSDGSSNRGPAWADGTNWRFADGTIVS
jgi:hypothetical protein